MKSHAISAIAIITAAIIVLAASRSWINHRIRNNPNVSDNTESCSIAVNCNTTDQQSKQRFVSLSPNITEILFALDLEENVVGVTSFCDYPDETKNKTIIGSITNPDFETIISLNPTAIFTTGSTLHKSFVERLNRIGCKSYALKIETISELLAAIQKLSDIGGVSDKGTQLCKKITKQLEEIRQTALNKYRPKILVIIQTEPLIVAGQKTLITELIETAGGCNAMGATASVFPRLNIEELLLCNPDIIIYTSSEAETQNDLERIKSHFARWPQITAVARNQIYMINADMISRPGPRICLAAKELQMIIDSTIIETKRE